MSDEKKSSDPEPPDPTTADQINDLEFATDIDDLNLEIVSYQEKSKYPINYSVASPKPSTTLGSPPNATENKLNPSIDDFVIAKQTSSSHTDHHIDQWFLKILDQEMGPFPFEDLVTLVANDEVGPEDFLRHGQQGEWIVAGEITGLIPEVKDDFELGSGVVFQGDARQKTIKISKVQVFGGEINHILSGSHSAPINPQQQPTTEQTDADQTDTVPEIKEPEKEPQTSAPAEALEEIQVAKKQEIANQLNAWLSEHVAPEQETLQDTNEEENFKPDTQPASSSPTVAGYQPPTHPGSTINKTFKQPRGKRDLSGLQKIFAPQVLVALGSVAVIATVIVVGMFMLNLAGGPNKKEIYLRYQEIYAQLQRAREGNPGQIAKIADMVIPELKEICEALEASGAGAKKPTKQKLFFAGKYCLIPILKSSHAEPGRLDEKFIQYQEETAKRLGIEQAGP